MKVAVIAQPRFPIAEPFAGGLESQTWHTVASLRSRGVQADLFGVIGSDFAADGFSFPAPDWTTTTVAPSDTTLPLRSELLRQRCMHELLDRLAADADSYDLVHNQCLFAEPLVRARELPMPMLTTLHTPPISELAPVAGITTSAFVAVSAHVSRSWSMIQPPPAVIHNGIDLDRWRRGPGGDDLVWFGRLVPEKAPHLAIEVAREAGRAIALAGRIGDANYFAEHIRPHLGRSVSYAGPLTQAQLNELVGHSAVSLVTSMWPEPFGLVAAEAAACGTPVVAFDCGGVAEVVDHGHTGFTVPQGDVTAMATAVDSAVRLDRSSIAGLARRFSLPVMVDHYLARYDDLISRDSQVTA